MPLHPTMYAQMLGEKIENENVNVWLINTGWSGGEYGIGKRIKLNYTRAMINAAMNNKLNDIKYIQHEIFGLYMPETCINVPSKILHPINTWNNTQSYQEKAKTLAKLFQANFFNISESTNDNANINKEQLALISKGGPIQF